MDRDGRLLRLIQQLKALIPPVGESLEVFLGNWQSPEIMFIGINPGTSGIPHPAGATAEDDIAYFTNYFRVTARQGRDERNIWKMFKRFGTGPQSGADWLRDSGSCVTNLYLWTTGGQKDLGQPSEYEEMARSLWPHVLAFIQIAEPAKIVLHGAYPYLCLRQWAGLPLEYAQAVKMAQPIASLRQLNRQLPDIPVAVNKHLSRFCPSEEVLQFVRRTRP